MTHILKVVGLNPSTVYWMDIFSHICICFKNCIFYLKRPKINEKEAGVGQLKKELEIGLAELPSSLKGL